MSDELLIRFHAAHTGASREVFDADGNGSSYARLAAAVRRGPVLDLGCGDGPLLERLVARGLGCTGLDMSPDELDAAGARLGDGVRLELGRAQELPFEDQVFETVVSHMAFMLMAPVRPVVDEVARVLRPGGRFVATIGSPAPPDAVQEHFWRGFDAIAGDEPLARIGDPETHDPNRLRELFDEGDWSGFRSESHPLIVDVPADRIGPWVQRACYHVDLLPEDRRRALFDWIEAERETLAPTGVLRWVFGTLQFEVTRRGSD